MTAQCDAALLHSAITDVNPLPFRDFIEQRLQRSMKAPGLLTHLAAQVSDRDAVPEELDRRIVGVQYIYEGLRLTRTLSRCPPWYDEPGRDANLEILAAEVLVAKGFSLIVWTEAMPTAVELLRTFGRDETNGRVERGDSVLTHRGLETDVFQLSIVAGVTATGADPPDGSRIFATKLAESLDEEFEEETHRFSASVVDELDELFSGSE